MNKELLTKEFKEKYHSNSVTKDDLLNLSFEQIKKLDDKNITSHMNISTEEKMMIKQFNLYKFLELYKYSKKDYYYVIKVLNVIDNSNIATFLLEEFINEVMLKTSASDKKKVCNNYLRDLIIKSRDININKHILKKIEEENKDIFLIDVEIDDKLKQKYFNRELLLSDVFYNIELFDKFPIENFIIENKLINSMINKFGYGSLVKYMKKYPEFFDYLIQCSDDFINEFANCISSVKGSDDDKNFKQAIKQYYINTYGSYGNVKPNWISLMNFKVIHVLRTANDLMNYDDNTVLLDFKQKAIIEFLGIDNLKKLQKSTLIFSGDSNVYIYQLFENFNILIKYFYKYKKKYSLFQKEEMPYEEFENEIVKYIDLLKSNNVFVYYDFIEGKFRKKHPEIFIDKNAPQNLINAFYLNEITPNLLFNHKEYIPYLLDKNLSNLIKVGIETIDGEKFTTKFINKYGNKKFLDLVAKYGYILNNIIMEYPDEDSEENIMETIENKIYECITTTEYYDYTYLSNVKSFKDHYPDVFLDLDKLDSPLKDKIMHNFYARTIYPIDIHECPQLIDLLKDKNLKFCFAKSNKYAIRWGLGGQAIDQFFLDLIDIVGNENFLKLCEKYGNYIYNVYLGLYEKMGVYRSFDSGVVKVKYKEKSTSYENIDKILEETLINRCLNGTIQYKEDAPDFLKQQHPELFLSKDAPAELKNFFYMQELSFGILNQHKDWLQYLKGKPIKRALLKSYISTALNYYFDKFGNENAIKLGIKKPETVKYVLDSNLIEKIDLMKMWYDKTGGKFIPDIVIMENINIKDADKFLLNTTNWNKLMKLKEFSERQEIREAMLKLAYSFGVFDDDKRGFNKVYELLTRIPKQIDKNHKQDIELMNTNIHWYILPYSEYFSTNKETLNTIIENMLNDDLINYKCGGKALIDLMAGIRDENIDIDLLQPIFSQIYKEREDGSYSLRINSKNCPKTTQAIKKILYELDDLGEFNLLSPLQVHQLFGGFKIEYNKEFREFLLNNIETILSNSSYSTYISSIQRQFNNIKIANSNRKLTLDLAVSYVQQNKYENVELGNEKVAEISAIAGYTQEDFDTLQKIYNYGKQRVFSSIPRIEGNTEKYTYEMLRLDDPLAMAIGTLTDCCQEIGNAAEVCMEHSMVDKNGRVFIIKDNEGNIMSQSWVWRNGNVLCFDNIEIPNKAFNRVDNRKKFTEEIYEIYKKASEELINKDEKVYKKLFDSGKIIESEYEDLKLKKVTVGIGYNDIAETLKKNSKKDHSIIMMPLKFTPPIKLDRNLYTEDSTTQYILKDDEKTYSFSGQVYALHKDLYEVYDNSNFTKKELIKLGKLEMINEQYSDILDIDKEKNLVNEIAELYELDKEKTKVIMNANFAIVYEEQENKIVVGDLFYNSNAGNMNIEDIIAMQIRLAIEQIKGNKEIDVSKLDKKQKEMYNKAINLNEEIDVEMGLMKKTK